MICSHSFPPPFIRTTVSLLEKNLLDLCLAFIEISISVPSSAGLLSKNNPEGPFWAFVWSAPRRHPSGEARSFVWSDHSS